jgi:CheY-like chemotaxis protein
VEVELALRRLAGMRVLLVEDNAINQQVAQELLAGEGALVTLADNGQLGVDAVRTAIPTFDAVLMDLQMPVMDGLRATRLLRADGRFERLPVIAMTANAMASDRDECIAAGMNDHIGKPFELNRLVHTLIQHTGWESRFAASSPAPLSAAPAAPLHNWPEGVEVELALARMGGNRGLLQRAIQAFVQDAALLPQRLERGLQAGDLAQLARDLHAFKGLSATVGVPQLSDLAAQAEQQMQTPQRQTGEYQQMLTRFTDRLTQFLPLLQSVADALTPALDPVAGEGTLDQAALEQLRELLQALQASDMVAMELHARLRQSLDASLAPAMESLDAAMAELEFDTAAAACEKLVRQFEPT